MLANEQVCGAVSATAKKTVVAPQASQDGASTDNGEQDKNEQPVIETIDTVKKCSCVETNERLFARQFADKDSEQRGETWGGNFIFHTGGTAPGGKGCDDPWFEVVFGQQRLWSCSTWIEEIKQDGTCGCSTESGSQQPTGTADMSEVATIAQPTNVGAPAYVPPANNQGGDQTNPGTTVVPPPAPVLFPPPNAPQHDEKRCITIPEYSGSCNNFCSPDKYQGGHASCYDWQYDCADADSHHNECHYLIDGYRDDTGFFNAPLLVRD